MAATAATTGTTAAALNRPPRSLGAVLLARRGVVHLPTAPRDGEGTRPGAVGAALLEADLLDRGFLLSADLRDAFASLGVTALAAAGRSLLADVDAALGADRPHVPLFRGFPHTVPADTGDFYVRRVFSVLLQAPEQPCVLCGRVATVLPVSPCAHLVCRACFDGADFSACPICHRRIDPADRFLRPGPRRTEADPDRAEPQRLRLLSLGGGGVDLAAAARAELTGLLARTGALSPQDRDDLLALLADQGRAELSWLPAEIPGRESKALVLAWLLADPRGRARVLPEVVDRLTTATDVLRLATVLSGGDAGLLAPARVGVLRRPVRRAMLAALDRLDPTVAAEEMRRHRGRWIPLAERLHAFEYATRFPRAALAVAALRESDLAALKGDAALSAALRCVAPEQLSAGTGGRLVLPSWGRRLEGALGDRDLPAALALLVRRPGELMRRLDLLLRLAGADLEQRRRVLDAARGAVGRVSPAVLLSVLGAMRSRLAPQAASAPTAEPGTGAGTAPESGPETGHAAESGRGLRVFFPKGGTAKAHVVADDRAAVPADAAAEAAALLTEELQRRAAAAPAARLAVVDAGLRGIVAPFAERTASRALLTLPRGSEVPVPRGRSVRLFLHWMEEEKHGRVDLDLSLALFDADWNHVGTCDYTNLRFAGSAAVHSGDLTSAPAPDGATEFADLDLDLLATAGVRHVVAVCFSYNNIAFEDMAEAFAGVMVRDQPGGVGPVFDPRAVEQRFDLSGRARACVPFVFDTARRTLRWLDVVQGVTGTGHAVHRHQDELGLLARELTNLYGSGARVGLGELAVRNAAGRATTVVVRALDGTAARYDRRTGEPVGAFAARIGSADRDGDAAALLAADRPDLAYLLHGDISPAPGAQVYALHPGHLDGSDVRLLTATDLVSALQPRHT